MASRRALITGILVSLLWTGAAAPVRAASYTVETITANRQSSEPSLAVDVDGHRHVAFVVTGDSAGIHYATDATGSWTDTLIAGTAGDHRPSIALDGDGNPAIAWSAADGGVRYASSATGWAVVAVSTEAGDAEASLAFDPGGEPHVAMRLGVGPPYGFGLGLFYASPDGTGGWTVEQLTPYEYDRDAVLAIDGSGRPHIAYNNGGDQLMYLTRIDGTWSSVFVAGGGVRHLAFALGPDGGPRAVISMPGDGTYLVTPDGDPLVDPWTMDLIASGYHDLPSLAIDSSDASQVGYRDGASGGAVVASKVDGSWVSVPVGSGSVERVSVAIDPTVDRPVLASDPTEQAVDSGIAVSTQAADRSWSDVQVSADAIDRLPDLALDPDGGEHVLFDRIGTDPGIFYGSKVGGSWQLERIGQAPEVRGIALAMAPDGSAHAVYTTIQLDTDQMDLTYATNRGGSWNATVIQTAGAFITGRDVAVGSDGNARIPYVGAGRRQTLNLATLGGRRAQTKVIDRGGFYSAPAITVDTNGGIHLVYQDANAMTYASNASGRWKFEPVPGGESAAGYPSIAVDTAGQPSIAIVNFQDRQVHILSRTSSGWTDATIATSDTVAFDSTPSIAIDGTVREVAFTAGGDPALAHLLRASDRTGDWVVDDVASAAQGFTVAIAVEGAGTVGIVYADGPSLEIARG